VCCICYVGKTLKSHPFSIDLWSAKFILEMVGPRVLQGESLETFNEGVGYIFNRWPALRGAVDYQQGGKNSHLKAEKLIDEIRSWFTKSNGKNHLIPVYNSNFVLF